MNLLQKALQQTEQIYELLKSRDWDSLNQISEERQKLLEQYFEQPTLSETSAEIQQTVEKIISIDKQAMTLIEEIKKEEISSTASLSRSFKAISQYTQT